MTTVSVGHVVIDERGHARLEGSRIRVIDLVMAQMANGWTPEELQQGYSHLTLAQVYGALAYYHAHKQELDEQIKRIGEMVERMRAEAGESPIVSACGKRGNCGERRVLHGRERSWCDHWGGWYSRPTKIFLRKRRRGRRRERRFRV
jgi:uncharacterized protein (DUF433 family)